MRKIPLLCLYLLTSVVILISVFIQAKIRFDFEGFGIWNEQTFFSAALAVVAYFFFLFVFMTPGLLLTRKIENPVKKFIIRFFVSLAMSYLYILAFEIPDQLNPFMNSLYASRYYFVHGTLAAGMVSIGATLIDRNFSISILKASLAIFLVLILNFTLPMFFEFTASEEIKTYNYVDLKEFN